MPLYGSHVHDYGALGVGNRIRDERQRQLLTLKDLERKTAISAGRLSQIENGLHVLDAQQAFAIAEALGLARHALLPRDVTIPYQITREREMRTKGPYQIRIRTLDAEGEQDHHTDFWPLADLFIGRHLEPMVARIPPAPMSSFYFHDDQEFFFVLAGTVEFFIKTATGVQEETITVGDCVYFNSSLPHFLRARDNQPAQTIHVLSGSSAETGAWAGPLASRHVYAEGTGETDDVAKLMGRRVRTVREALRLTSRQVSTVIGISESQLLQIESGRRSLGLDALIKLARACGKPLREFTGEPSNAGAHYFVQRRSEISKLPFSSRRSPHGSGGVIYQSLADGFSDRQMYPYLVKVKNGAHETMHPREHHGQEFIYVLDGQVELTTTVDGEQVTESLAPGDACYLDCSVPHSIKGHSRNPYSSTIAELIEVFWCPVGEDYLFGTGSRFAVEGEMRAVLSLTTESSR